MLLQCSNTMMRNRRELHDNIDTCLCLGCVDRDMLVAPPALGKLIQDESVRAVDQGLLKVFT